MSLFEQFITELKAKTTKQSTKAQILSNQEAIEDLQEFLHQTQEFLAQNFAQYLDDFSALQTRSTEPMSVAITGQFSSGKSTFLNALLKAQILPMGITPVTSKVNIIKYGSTPMLRVCFNNGTEQDYALSKLASFTDQRQNVQDISHLSIFYPLEILKKINLIDTPGLNSRSNADTKTTKDVLKKVDAIIWLSLIDSAGKRTEEESLEEFLEHFSDKSLCVLNQKDKLSQKEVAEVVAYVQKDFSKFFKKVVAISAKQALDSGVNIRPLKEALIQEIQTQENISQAWLTDVFSALSKPQMQDKDLYKTSNIQEVLDFINQELSQKIGVSKHHAIKYEAKQLLNTIKQKEQKALDIFIKFSSNMDNFYTNFQDEILSLANTTNAQIQESFKIIQTMLDKITSTIYKNIKDVTKTRFVVEQGLFKQEKISKETYTFYEIDKRKILTNLFEKEEIIKKDYLKYKDQTQEINAQIQEFLNTKAKQLTQIIQDLKDDLNSLNEPKTAQNAQDFLLGITENLNAFFTQKEALIQRLNADFNQLHLGVFYIYKQATTSTIAALQEQKEIAQESYEKSPSQFPFTTPSNAQIAHILEENFALTNLKKTAYGNLGLVFKTLSNAKLQSLDLEIKLKELSNEQIIPMQKRLKALENLS